MASVVAALKMQASVHAVWLEGSAASRNRDAYSDIDLWLDVDQGLEEQVFGAIREALLEFGPLELEQPVDHPHPQLRQRFYRLAGSSPFHFLDVCVQQHGRGTMLPSHEPFRVLYDPEGVVQIDAVPRDIHSLVSSRLTVLRAAWWRRILVLKEVERGQVLEALGYYHTLGLEPLTELSRLRHCPEKFDYGLKHLYRDLPVESVGALESLYTVTALADIPAAVARADDLFEALMDELA